MNAQLTLETAAPHCEWERVSDPAFLGHIGVYRNIGDRLRALSWYRRARDLGDTEAAQLLENLESR